MGRGGVSPPRGGTFFPRGEGETDDPQSTAGPLVDETDHEQEEEGEHGQEGEGPLEGGRGEGVRGEEDDL